ncbi:ricin-type beta-trefoil lectin domain protein [Actinoplanes sp. HUAS TT8]|uniref:ricin-type beta-trefoil lectin domain protein n=1 Tax=Actinoplanes sp. HUAS TT8 TaxID=3447453 RepID=UPI003F51EC47
MRRRIAVVTAVAVMLAMGLPAGAVPEGGSFPLAGLLSWLRQAPVLAAVAGVPRQDPGHGAGQVDHYVSAGKTHADGGSGSKPGKGLGAVDADLPDPEAKKRWTAPKKGGPNSFDAKTSKRLPKKSTAKVDEFENADGSITRQVHDTKVNYRAADGSYQPIDTTLTRRGKRLAMTANSVDVTLGATGTGDVTAAAPAASPSPAPSASAAAPSAAPGDALASVTTASGAKFAYDLAGAADVPAVVSGSTATYPGILPETDLELRTIGGGLKETIVLKSPAAGNEWVFPLTLQGLTVKPQDDGSLILVDAKGQVALRGPPGYMEDSKVDPKSGAPAQSAAVRYELTTVDGKQALKVIADATWLNDPARQYPVRIDPTVYETYDTGDTYVDTNTGTNNHAYDNNLPVGTWDGGDTVSRSFMALSDFDKDFKGTQVKGAKLFLYHTWSYDCTNFKPVYVRRILENWSQAAIGNGNLSATPAYSSAIGTLEITNNSPACTNTGADRSKGAWRTVSLDPQAINLWTIGAAPNYGLALTASETDSTAFKRFTSRDTDFGKDPYLEITYDDNEIPQVDQQYPAYGASAATLTPELLAEAHDSDSWPYSLKYQFFVYGKDAKTQIAASGKIATKRWTVPAGVLKWGETYYWKAVVYDGLLDNAKYATQHLLNTQVPQPAVTSGLAQNPDKGYDPVVGNFTTASRDAMINTVGPPLEIVRSYNSIDPRIDQAFGAGWSSVLDAKAVDRNVTAPSGSTVLNSVVVTYPNGRDLAFGRNNDGTFTSPAGPNANFVSLGANAGYRLTEKDGTTYEFTEVLAAGRYALSAIKDAAGRTEKFFYSGGRLTKITSASGRSLGFTWNTASPPRVTDVYTDPVAGGDWNTANTWKYEYAGNNLTKVCAPSDYNNCHTYQYGTGSRFPSAVGNSRPYSYWRLTEGSGTTAASSVLENAGVDNGTYSGVTLGQTGPLSGSTATAAGFNGTSSLVKVPADLDGDTSNQAVSLWFNAPAGGGDSVLYGQSWDAAASNTSTTKGAFNPTLYLGSDGYLMGSFPKAPKVGASLGSLTAYGNGQCLSVKDNNSANNAGIVLDDCAGTANQNFTWTAGRQLQVTTGGAVKCVDAIGSGLEIGKSIVTFSCNGAASQIWDVRPDGQIVGDAGGFCLDSQGAGNVTDAQLLTWTCGKTRKPDQSFVARTHTALKSKVAVADGKWHHVVLSAAGNKQELYLDDDTVPVTETGVVVQDMSAAISYIGTGFLGGGWPNQSHDNGKSNAGTADFFKGSIAEVAYYDTEVDKQVVADLRGAKGAVKPLTQVNRQSGQAASTVVYDGVTGRVSKLTDGNGSVWTPATPTVTGTSKVHESAVLGGAPTNYWRMAETGAIDAVNQVNGDTATYSGVTSNPGTGPFSTADSSASFDELQTSYVDLPAGVLPVAGTGQATATSVSMWFRTENTAGPLLGESVAGSGRVTMPTIWIDGNGGVRAVAPSSSPTGPINAGEPGKCLDVENGGTANGTPVQIYTCNGTASQTWSLEANGTVRALGKCLEVAGAAKVDGTEVQMSTCTGGVGQIWQPFKAMKSSGGFRNPNSGMCLTRPFYKPGTPLDGVNLVISSCVTDIPSVPQDQDWWFGLGGRSTVIDGKWHHVALTVNNTTQTLYLDGQKIQWAGGTAFTAPATQPDYYVGAGYNSAAWPVYGDTTTGRRYYNGAVAEVAFYRSELEEAQVGNQFKARDAAKAQATGQINYTLGGPDNSKTTVVNDIMFGRKVADVDALGKETRYGYSGKGYLRTVTDPNGNMTVNEYDVRGNVVSVTTCQDRSANRCSTSYNTYYPDATTENPAFSVMNDRVLTQRGTGSASATDNTYLTTYTYDTATGNRTGMVDPLGRKTAISYTDGSTAGGYNGATVPAGLPWRIVKPGGGVQTILYSASGDIAEVTDPAGMVTRYEYDGIGRTVKELQVGATTTDVTTFTHDRSDRVITRTDPPVLNRVSSALHTPVTTLSYTVDGLLAAETVSDATGGDASRTVAYGYDTYGRKVSETDELGNKLKLGYDAFGRVTSQIHADLSEVVTKYDAVGNELETVVKAYKDAKGNVSDLSVRKLTYDPAGRLASEVDAKGFVTDYAYTDNNLLVTVTQRDPTTGQSYVEERNEYDATGNLSKQTTNNGLTVTERKYDNAGRNHTTTLDPAGLNRSTVYGYSLEDEVVSTTLKQGDTVLSSSETAYDRLGRAQQQTTYLSTGLTPTLRWPMNQSSGALTADTAGNNAGAVTGNVAWSTERNGAASFTATQAGISGRAPVDTLRPYTISTWAKVNDASDDRFVVSLPGDSGGSALKLLYDKDTESWQINLAVRKPDGTTGWVSATASEKAVAGTWTHLAVTVDPTTSTAKLYVGGRQLASVTADFNNRATGLLVGAQNADSGYFSGLIDDLQTYQKALSDSEIGQLLAGTAPSADARVVRTSADLDVDGSATAMFDAAGTRTDIENDSAGRAVVTVAAPAESTNKDGVLTMMRSVTKVGYNTFGEPTEEEDANGGITTAKYDGVGRLIETALPAYTPKGSTTPITPVTKTEYNAVGQPVASFDPFLRATRYEYDQLGRTTKVTAPDGNFSKYEYDTEGNLLSHEDPAGGRGSATYDYLDRTVTSTEEVRQSATPLTTNYTYGNGPWPTGVKSPGNVTAAFTYNSAGEQTFSTDGAGKITETRYDGLGRPVRVIAPDKTYTTATYDLAGRTTASAEYSAADVQLRQVKQGYDLLGNVISSTDAKTITKTFEYDVLGRMTTQHEPISSGDEIKTRFWYDAAGQQTRYSDGRENLFVTTYNPWGLVATQVEPATTTTASDESRTFTLTYNEGGQLTRVDSPGGVSVTSEYDNMGRLHRSSGTGAQATTVDRVFEYDKVGRVTSLTGSAGATTVAYDDRGLVTEITGISGASSYKYDDDGRLTTRTDGAGTTSYVYDGAGRLATLANTGAGLTQTYQYDDMSQVKSITYGGGNTRTFGYNDLHQLTSDELKTSAGATVAKIAYGFDLNDNLTKKTTTGFNGASTNTYSYDQANRLTQWDNGTNPVVYAYDKSGNRLQAGSKTFVYDQRNQLVSDSDGTAYQYTARGTLRSTTKGGVATNTVTDAFNQVISQGTSNYAYDGLGRVVQPNLTYTGLSNTVAADGTTAYIRDPGDGLAGVKSGATGRYAWTDLHTDVVGEFTATGTTLPGSVSYDPWGKVLASGGMLGKLGYQSEWTDQGTGKVNMMARWYDPETGTFDTRDTASNSPNPTSGAANRFAYAEGNPLTNTDTTGNGVDGKCGEYDYACAMKQYQAELAQYNDAMAQRDRDMKAAGTQIAQQEADYQRAERESNTPLLDILLQVGIGMLLDLIGYNAVVGCIGGSAWDCFDLATNFMGPLKVAKVAKTIWRTIDRAMSGFKMWKRIVEGARTMMRRAQDLMNAARKVLNDVTKKIPKKPKVPKKKPKPPTKKKPKPKPKPQPKPKPSKPATPPKPKHDPKKSNKPSDAKPKKERDRTQDRQKQDRNRDNEPERKEDGKREDAPETCPPQHSFEPSTRVVMADGTARPISEITVGDTVLTKDPVTEEVSPRQVTLLHANRDHDLTDVTVSDQPVDSAKKTAVQSEGKGGRSTRGPTESAVLHTTAHHPFWDATTGNWVDAADLVPGESTLVGPDGELQYVTDVNDFAGAKVMRDLTVADIHTYYVFAGDEPVLVHNNSCSAEQLAQWAKQTADDIHSQISWWKLREVWKTTSVTVASRGDGSLVAVVNSNGKGLAREQLSYINKLVKLDAQGRPNIMIGENIAGMHAEKNGAYSVAMEGLNPIAGGVNRNSCSPDGCETFLGLVGAAMVGPSTRGTKKKILGQSMYVWRNRDAWNAFKDSLG